MHSVCRCSLLVWRRSFLKKRTPVTYFCPALDPPLGKSRRKTTTPVRDNEYFMHTSTKFHQNPSSGSAEEVENVKVYGRRRTTTDVRTDDGRCAMTIAHLSIWLRWAKKQQDNTPYLWYPIQLALNKLLIKGLISFKTIFSSHKGTSFRSELPGCSNL